MTKFIQKSTYFKKVDNEKSLFIQIIKDLLYKNNLTNKVKDRIKKNNLSINNLNFFLDKYYNLKCQNKISEIIKLKTENSANSGEFKRSLIFNTIKNRPLIQIRYFFNYCFRFINSKILSQDGMHVILLGPDGAGKSTIGELVYDSALVNDFYEEKIYGHTNFKIIPPLQLFLKPFKNNYTKKEYIPRDIKKLSTIKAMIYPLYYLIDYMLGFLWLYKKKTNGGAFVIFDRYFDEYYIQKTFHNLSNKYLNDSIWIKEDVLVAKLPILNVKNSKVLKKPNFTKLQDSLGVYLVKIEAVLKTNDIAPLSYVKPTIEQIILNKRKQNLLKKIQKDITIDAIKNKNFEIFSKN